MCRNVPSRGVCKTNPFHPPRAVGACPTMSYAPIRPARVRIGTRGYHDRPDRGRVVPTPDEDTPMRTLTPLLLLALLVAPLATATAQTKPAAVPRGPVP